MPENNDGIPKLVVQVPVHDSTRPSHRRQQSRQYPQQGGRRRKGNPVKCNKCKTPLSGTLFLLKCNCILCEECTYSHFEKNTNCPTCNRIMSDDDFTELMVRKELPSHKHREKMRSRIFVKATPESRSVNTSDLWYRIQRQHSMLREGTKFFLRQFMKENNSQTKRSSQIQQALTSMNKDRDGLKRENHKQKQRVETFKQKLILAHEKLDEKDRQLQQFRKIVVSKTSLSSSVLDKTGHREHHSYGGVEGVRKSSNLPPTTRPKGDSSNEHQYYETPSADRDNRGGRELHNIDKNGYHQQGRNGDRPKTHSTNPYNRDLRPPWQEPYSHRRRSSSNNNKAFHDHSHHHKDPAPPPVTQPPPSESHSYYHHHHPHSENATSVGSASTNSGGKIRKITASTPYSFSGGTGKRTKGPLSPTTYADPYQSQASRGHRTQSY